jgi:hypothetical protein
MRHRQILTHQGVRPDIPVEAIHGGRDMDNLAVHDTRKHLDPLGNPGGAFEFVEKVLEEGIPLHQPFFS